MIVMINLNQYRHLSKDLSDKMQHYINLMWAIEVKEALKEGEENEPPIPTHHILCLQVLRKQLASLIQDIELRDKDKQ